MLPSSALLPLVGIVLFVSSFIHATNVEWNHDNNDDYSSIKQQTPTKLWIDTDPSGLVWTGLDCDDDLAVLVALALHQRGDIDLQGISICGGNAPLAHTWPDIHRLLEYVAMVVNIKPVKGYGWKSMHVAWKRMKFFDFLTPDMNDSQDATNAFIELSKQETTASISILMLGPNTNLARAIDGGLKTTQAGGAIDHVYLMGGELTGQQIDLNFRSDRAAARTVLDSELPTTIIPIQTCGQVTVTQSYVDQLDCPGMAACALLPKMKQQVKLMPRLVNQAVKKRFLENDPNSRWKATPNLDYGFVPWDVIALLAISHPDELFDEWEYHRVAIPPCAGLEPCDKTMKVLENLGPDYNVGNWSGIVRVPHQVRNESRLLDTMFSLLNEVPAVHPTPPPLFWGFIGTTAGLAGVTIALLLWIF
jgi:inosine-uridine nucleoside N-ribohydrolase